MPLDPYGQFVEYVTDLIPSSVGKFQEAMNSHSSLIPQNNYSNLIGTPWENFTYPGLPQSGYDTLLGKINDFIGNGDFRGLQGYLTSITGPNHNFFTPEVEKWLDNMINQQATLENRSWEEEQASTNLLKAGDQLQQLGLSASGVLSTGGSNVNGVSSANNSMANLAQQNKLAKYNQKMAMARQILSMTSSMASAGIYGSAIGAAKKAAGVITANAAHSGYGAIKAINKPERSYPDMSREDILKLIG